MISLALLAVVALAGDPAGHGGLGGRRDVHERAFDAPPAAWWKVRLPGGRVAAGSHTERARPVIVGDEIYVGGAAGEALYVLSRNDGSLVRTLPARASVEAAAAVQGDHVYFSDTAGYTYCYTLDGTKVWEHEGEAPVLTEPALANGQVIVTNVDDLTVALSASDGAFVWRYRHPVDLGRESELSLYAAPPAVPAGDEVLLGFSDGSVVSVAADDGAVRWERKIGEGRYPDIVAAPVVAGNDVYASAYFSPFVAIDRDTHNVRWRIDAGAADAVLLQPGDEPVLFHPGTDGKLRAVAARTGDVLWTWDSGTSGALSAPVSTAAGLLIASSYGGVYLVDPATGHLVWQYHEPRKLVGVTAAPVVDGGQLLFVSNAGWLYSMLVPRQLPRPEPLLAWRRTDGPP